MLHPDDRCLLSEQVLPPHGYAFTDALICTYSLDLTALGGVPLALLQSDPLALGDAAGARLEALRAVREMATRLSVFCQAGAIHVPSEWRDAFLWLEASVVQVRPAATRAVFHPKLWLLRFANQAGAVHYRLLVLSRNLTYDRSWDVIARLEGPVIDRQNAIRAKTPLVQFVEALGEEAAVPAVGGLAEAHRGRRDRFARELRTVRFDAQDEQVKDWAFWPLGIPGHQYPLAQLFDGRRSPFQAWSEGAQRAGRRMLVVSPFLSGGIVDMLSASGFPVSLISRDDALDEQHERLPDDWFPEEGTSVHSFRQELSLEGAPLSGLHAKLWVADDGWDAHLWVGSANATEAAFTRNVEFLLQLSGARSKMGIDALLGDNGLAPLTTPYLRPSHAPDEALLTLKRQQEALDWLLNALVTEERLSARIVPTGESVWALTLAVETASPLQVECLPVRWMARPSSVPWSRVGSIDEVGPACRCADLALHELTEFWTLALEVPGTELRAETTVRLRAQGDWPTFTARESATLSRHLRDADSLALYLEFMLAGDDEALRQRLRRQRQQGQGDGRRGATPLRPLFETLLQALAERPEALAEVVELVESSRESGLMQDSAFRALWATFREAQARLLPA
ncbi:phospholipase D family protein [Roseateles sp.]|uniref:phospholipase D family protein n=1 Tax=Roseateles sp. TaxID=1971397 RepID=UPI003943CD72